MSVEVKEDPFKHFFGGKSPDRFIYEDEQCVAFDEIMNPQAPVHFLVVPKKMIPRLCEASLDDEKLLGHLLIVARRVAIDKGVNKTGFRVVMNEGPHSTQTLEHFHVHVLGGRQMWWPFNHMLSTAKNIATDRGLHGYHVTVDETYIDHSRMKLKSIHVFSRALHHMIWPVGPGFRL